MNQTTFLRKILEKQPEIDNLELVERAFVFAEQAHRGQKRKSGEDYIEHPIQTALILADLKLNAQTISAGLLHDVIDDTSVTVEELIKKFNPEIAFLVNGVTKLGKIKYRGAERQVENLRKMFFAMAQDIRVILIKLADRLHNLRTLHCLPPEKQRRIALETLDIYAPIANRLSLGQLRGELEDWAFTYAYPREYEHLIQQVKDHYQERENYLKKIQPLLEKELIKEGLKPLDIHSRAKHYYSLYKKLEQDGFDLNKIYDLVALRVIVANVEECYAGLGAIHKLWKPLPGRIKDYIALAKPNGYRSLHTTVFCEGGKITELQIRTPEMHQEAEYGIAAHWIYDDQKKQKIKNQKEVAWIKDLLRWQTKSGHLTPEEFLNSLKIDFFNDRIFVFTPQGDVIDLPLGATAIDFAFQIHTEIGRHCAAAMADGRIIALDEPLQSGWVIEIIAKKNILPNQRWLEFAKTTLARSHIKAWIRKDFPESKMPEAKPIDIEINQTKIAAAGKAKNKKLIISGRPAIKIGDETKILFSLAKCCSPQIDQPIHGYITLNQGISVHQADCPNLRRIKKPERLIPVDWQITDQ